MSYEEIILYVKGNTKKTTGKKTTKDMAVEFNITGEGEGAFYIAVKNGKIAVEPYEYYDRDVLFICTADTLMDLIDGKLDPLAAYNSKRLKVKGDLGKALRLKDMLKS